MSDVLAAAGRLTATGGRGALITPLDAPGERILVEASGTVTGGWTPADLAGILRRIESEDTGVAVVEGREVFVEVLVPPPTVRIFGAGPIAEALCRLAARAGFRVVVGDPRAVHAVAERFPDADEVACGWPDDLIATRPLDHRSYVVSLLHADRFEDRLLPAALASPAPYVGALGSRRTHTARRERLAGLGVPPADLDRIHAPIGLPIGAVTAEEIAVAILAEMVGARRGAVAGSRGG